MKVGDRWEKVLVEELDRTRIVMYAGASGDFAQVHHDESVAQAMGYPSIFAHGMLTVGMTGRLLEEIAGERLTRYAARMTSQVWPGDTLTASATVVSIDAGVAELAVRTVNQRGETVVDATATMTIDGGS